MTLLRYRLHGLVATLAIVTFATTHASQEEPARERPSLSLRATPPVGFTPLRVRFIAQLRGGDNDHPDYYCPSVVWDWGDGTRSESSIDCDPYIAGVSEIRRRYTAEHIYRDSGGFRMRFRLLQGDDDIVESTDIRIQVRRGTGED
jgi:hypothetical protein